ncbi:hypothetical protein THIARS_60478 [Thiomonas delicata]|uniref:Uncharacterized protein n=1 Tax=Thiomonas delicata TaxID=364030 RepID=A0A238D3F0_THIDL|nr:hypothetical protein THIARS_60478 [Thiomonas delicata]
MPSRPVHGANRPASRSPGRNPGCCPDPDPELDSGQHQYLRQLSESLSRVWSVERNGSVRHV